MNTDTTTWGPQPNGWYTPTQEDILGKIQEDQRAFLDADFDTDPDSPEGQNAAIFSRQMALAWEALAALNAAKSRDGAEGDMLDGLGAQTGTPRTGARPTRVRCNCALKAGTFLQAGVSLAHVFDKPDVLFTPTANLTAELDTTYVVLFECLEDGPTPCPAGQLNVIATPLTGWTSITNPEDGVLGQEPLADPDYRLEQLQDLTRAGSSTAAALAVDLVYDAATGTGVPGVLSADVLENDTDSYDQNGVPPRAIEVVIYQDGSVVAADLARAIWEGRKAGTRTAGTSSVQFVDDIGYLRTVRYSEIQAVPIYLSYTLTTSTGYVGAAAVKAAVVEYLTARARPGVDVMYLASRAIPLNLTGVADVPTFSLGVGPAPIGTSNISINSRQIATFSAANITVTP